MNLFTLSLEFLLPRMLKISKATRNENFSNDIFLLMKIFLKFNIPIVGASIYYVHKEGGLGLCKSVRYISFYVFTQMFSFYILDISQPAVWSHGMDYSCFGCLFNIRSSKRICIHQWKVFIFYFPQLDFVLMLF